MDMKIKAMISDDSDEVYGAWAREMSAFGIELLPAPCDGLRLLEAIAQKQPQIVIAEAFMPGMDAGAVLGSIARMEKSLVPKIIVISGFASTKLESQMLRMGAVDFFTRPVDVKQLCIRIHEIISGMSGRAASEMSIDDGNLMLTVTDILRQIGVPAHIKGYGYLRTAIIAAVNDPHVIDAVTKELYPAIARSYDTLPSRVERAIRHAIEISWDRGDVDVIHSYFGCTVSTMRGKPTNSEFIAMIADKLRVMMHPTYRER